MTNKKPVTQEYFKLFKLLHRGNYTDLQKPALPNGFSLKSSKTFFLIFHILYINMYKTLRCLISGKETIKYYNLFMIQFYKQSISLLIKLCVFHAKLSNWESKYINVFVQVGSKSFVWISKPLSLACCLFVRKMMYTT